MTRHSAPGAEDALSLRNRQQSMEAVWLFTLAAAFFCVMVPWYLRALEIEPSRASWCLFAWALAILLMSLVARRTHSGKALLALVVVQQIAGPMVLALAWHLAGGLFHALFLLVFALPVAAAAVLLPSWIRWLPAAAAAGGVPAVALMESSALRWFVVHSRLPVGPVADLLPPLHWRTAEAYPDLVQPPGQAFAIVVCFVIAVSALAWLMAGVADAAADLRDQSDEESGPRKKI